MGFERGFRLVVLLLVTVLAGCPKSSGDGGAGDKIVVVSSIFPVHDLVKRVGGDAVKAELLLTPGQSAHDFNPSPKLAKTCARAKLAFVIGLQLDDWATKTIEAANSSIPIVALGPKVNPMTFEVNTVGAPKGQEHGHDDHGHGHGHDDHGHGHDDHGHGHGQDDHGHGHGHDDHGAKQDHGHHHPEGPDPHVWLDVSRAIAMVDVIEQKLAEVAPAKKATFAANAKTLKEELTALHGAIKKDLDTAAKKSIVTYHGSFGYFAKAYGVRIAAVIEPFPGKQPSAAYLKNVMGAVKGKKVAALFTEPQLDGRPAEVLAKEAGLPLKKLDPLGGVEGRDSYAKLMRFNLTELVGALQK